MESSTKGKKKKIYNEVGKYNSFTLWLKQKRPLLMKANPNLSIKFLNKVLNQLWQKMPANNKLSWKLLAKKLNRKIQTKKANNKIVQPRLSGRMMWANEIRADLLKENPELNLKTMNKKLSVMWSTLPAAEKINWCVRAKTANRMKINKEKIQRYFIRPKFTNYTLWSREVRPGLIQKKPDMNFVETSKTLSALWRNLPVDEKLFWRLLADEENKKILTPESTLTVDETPEMKPAIQPPINSADSEVAEISRIGFFHVEPLRLVNFKLDEPPQKVLEFKEENNIDVLEGKQKNQESTLLNRESVDLKEQNFNSKGIVFENVEIIDETKAKCKDEPGAYMPFLKDPEKEPEEYFEVSGVSRSGRIRKKSKKYDL